MEDEQLDTERIEQSIDRIEATIDTIEVTMGSISQKLDFLLKLLEVE